MRQAGTIATKPDAERFSDYLLSQGITSKVEASDGQWAVWIHDDDALQRSKKELAEFLAAPQDERYRAAEPAARQAKREMAARERQARRNNIDLRNEWARPWRRRPVTSGMIAVCVAVALPVLSIPLEEVVYYWPAIVQGELWRLVTPIFFHAGILHLLFNMFMLYEIGSLIEWRLGSWRYLLLVLVIAIASNATQYIARGPNFVGMSGVVYGLFGYAWVRGRLDPTCGLYLTESTVFSMLVWFVLCSVGVIGNVANWAHGGGLAAGAVLAYLNDQLRLLRKKT